MILKIKNSTLILCPVLSDRVVPTAETISAWVRQTDRDEGRRTDGLTSRERAELHRLR